MNLNEFKVLNESQVFKENTNSAVLDENKADTILYIVA